MEPAIEEASIEEWLAKIERLVTGRDQLRDFVAAHRVAVQTTQAHPSESRGWHQLVLLCNLTDQHDKALEAQAEAARQCAQKWTLLHEGDCERDHALFCVRHGRPFDALRHLARARRYHQGNANRLIVLRGVEGCLWYSQKLYANALKCFIQAELAWQEMEVDESTEQPNPQWRFNNDRWTLKTLVALRLSKRWSRALWASLQARMPVHGSPDLEARLRFVMRFGRLGNRLDDFVASPRGYRLVTRLHLVPRWARRITRAAQ